MRDATDRLAAAGERADEADQHRLEVVAMTDERIGELEAALLVAQQERDELLHADNRHSLLVAQRNDARDRAERAEQERDEAHTRASFLEAAADAPFTQEGQDNLRRRLSGLAKAIDEEMQPGAREFCLASVDEFAVAYRSLRHDHDQALDRAERAEATNTRLRDALEQIAPFLPLASDLRKIAAAALDTDAEQENT